uniref:DNA-directed RNA polymerase RpoA/D/Rpb3-type domain-containing protein n=1 Tax=viral metagenome TaxID=1070528 RepID=A0A6C0D7Q0_9ZZZZ
MKTSGVNTSASFKNIQFDGKDTLKFQLVNTNVSYANTLRRVILTEIPTVAFRAEIQKNGSTSDITIEKNTTAMSNEMLAHRIGLVLVHANPKEWDPEKYSFELNVENSTNDLMDVKVSDMNVYENTEAGRILVPNTKFFHPDPITRDTCLLAVLKPKIGNASPEAVSFKAKASVGIGRENMRFSPVSQCSYSYTRDESPEKIKEVFVRWLDRHKKINYMELEEDSERKKLLEREFNTMEVGRCFVIDEKGEPNSFDFTVETVGAFNPLDIVIEALKVIEQKCFVYAALDKGDIPENIKIQPTKKEARGFDIYFQGEDHTLGNMLTTFMDEYLLDPQGLRDGSIQFCGYCVPHPLRDEMLMTIIAKDDLVCRKAIASAAMNCGKMFASWAEALTRARR